MTTFENTTVEDGPGGERRHVEVAEALAVVGAEKTYGHTQALRGVDLRVDSGRILGLVGANGAGKSTLLRIVSGAVRPSAGSLRVDGGEVDFARYGPRDAHRLGIYTVYQELSVFTNVSLAENYLLGRGGRLRRRAAAAAARAALGEVFPDAVVPSRTEVGWLPLAVRQMIEIALAATQPHLRVLIMDEPTSALSSERIDQLHAYLRRRVADGVAVVYVTHKLDEVLQVSDRLVVLRDGRVSWDDIPGAMTRDELVAILGAVDTVEGATAPRVADRPPPTAPRSEPAVVEARAGGGGASELRVEAGEVVGLAGLEGAGQRALLRTVFAARGRRRAPFAVRGGAAYVSGDRRREGVFYAWTIFENLLVSALATVSSFGFVRRREARTLVRGWFDALGIVAAGPGTSIGTLSGGNQQKVVIGRGLASGARLVLLDDPTRGVDIQTKSEFYGMLRRLREDGRSAILYSTEDREFLECDRVYVLARGAVVKELRGDEIGKEAIVRWSYAAPAGGAAAVDADDRGGPRLRRVAAAAALAAGSRLSLALVLFAGVVAASWIAEPSSMSSIGIDLLLGAALPLILASLAQMFVVVAGDIDVGVGYAIGLTNVITATTLVSHPLLGWLMLAAVVAGYGAMAVLAELTGVPAIVITLGASFIWLGCGLSLQQVPGGTSPLWLQNALGASFPLAPEPVWIAAALAAAGYVLLRRTRFGMTLRAFGNNRQSYLESGRSCLRARVATYLLAGLCVVGAGALITGTTTASDVNASATFTLGTVAAVVIGGAEFVGGVVEPVGAVVAAIALGLIPSVLTFVHVRAAYETAVTGLVLVAAMAVRRLVQRGTRL